MYAAIEAGGTKFVVAVADHDLNIVSRFKTDTKHPEIVMPRVISFLQQFKIESIGVGSFGPIGINNDLVSYGKIKHTPKNGWQGFDFLGNLKRFFDVPIYWTTDVNIAAYGELKMGAAKDKKNIVYLTVGTGIGGGVIIDGKIMNGYSHPEIGHILMQPMTEDKFEGICPYHSYCLEGIAAGPALEVRAGKKAELLEASDPIWDIEAFYLAQGVCDLTVSFSPEMVIFGGGVSNQTQLFDKIRGSFEKQLNNYVDVPELDKYIVHAGLGDDAGIMGGLLLAKEILQ